MRLVQREQCVHKLALSCCVGVFIAFCPFIGFHTILTFGLPWLFSLNFAIVLGVSMLIHNPWTMVPIYGAGHMVGDYALSLCGINHYACNPSWVIKLNAWLLHYTGISGFSFWAFMLGCTILACLFSLLTYPVVRWIAGVITKNREKVLHTVLHSKQAVHTFATKAKPMLQSVVNHKLHVRKRHEISDSK